LYVERRASKLGANQAKAEFLATLSSGANPVEPGLHTPLKVGAWMLKHRVVMAPLNRLLASAADGVPSRRTIEHYAVRASEGGLIVAESIAVSPLGIAQPGTAGIFESKHVNAWSLVTQEVHGRGGLIVAQLWHAGRLARLAQTRAQPISASALDDDGIDEVIDQYRRAAENAADAGFDGVEMSCAYGCLADQFLQEGSNLRTDRYGGSIANRVRFLVDAVQALCAVWGPARIGVRLSPYARVDGMDGSAPEDLLSQVLARMHDEQLAYVHVVVPSAGDGMARMAQLVRASFGGAVIAAGGFDADSAREAIATGAVDAIAFGRSAALSAAVCND
jgi:N-ethylmaleimide reductase